eukprot:TRINITY_DN15229_c0_g1_i1.p1 TRINITY_DN15229_c0_g1~~TRINITY_DN15229_c0_g1_i1.p1  ORF type:complete len:414 (-),score=106.15 TRINITY_DN15229_c0_g1_i1:27-1244(-)
MEGAYFLIAIFFGSLILGLLVSKKAASLVSGQPKAPAAENQKAVKKPVKQQQQQPKASAKKVVEANHPAWLAEMKGKDEIRSIAWDPRNRFLAATTKETVVLYDVDSLVEKSKKSYPVKIDGMDSPVNVAFSTNGFFVLSYSEKRELEAYATLKKKNEEGKLYKFLKRFPGQDHGDIVSLQVTPDCKNIMTAARDTTITIMNLKGVQVDKLQTKQLQYNMATISPDGKYLAIAAAMSDIKLHKLNYTAPAPGTEEAPTLSGIEKTFFTRLEGHTGGVTWVQFSSDSKKMLSTSKDGTWKLWDISVDFKAGLTPKVILTGSPPVPEGKAKLFYPKVYLSPDNRLIAAPLNKEIHFWSAETGKLIEIYNNSHLGYISELTWSPDSDRVATFASDNVIRVFKVPSVNK